ncbi:unnamed protein product [Auanema sp. JU1783]|nr:unnamed protein product [Auanema sp. JU1783]
MLQLSIFILHLAFVSTYNYSPRVYSGTQKCYSCMSRYYGATWHFAGYARIYQEPRSFTESCRDPQSRGSDVQTTHCDDDSNCISMVEDLKIGTGAKGYIRGCWSSILLFGFNRTSTVGALSTHSFCHTFNLSQLVAGGKPQESSVSVCSCRGSLCNGMSLASSSALSKSFIVFLYVLLVSSL